MAYRRCGRSGLLLPAVSLGLWQNFGDDRPIDAQRAIVRRAFDLGITHFDLANNYGPPYGSAETNSARILREDLRDHRDELVISTKAGWDMWPGPYGDLGSRKYLIASLDQSLHRLGLEYVDIFYHHHYDPNTPLEESLGALHTAVTSGKALYVGVSSYSDERTAEAVSILRQQGTPLLIHQPSYSMFNRWIEDRLLDVLDAAGVGCIAFSVLAQGLLSDRYLNGVPPGSRTCSTRRIAPGSGPSTRSDGGGASHSRRWQSPGRCVTPGSPQRSSGRAVWPNSSRTCPPSTTWSSPPRSSPPSTAMPLRAASTCGAPCRHRDTENGITTRCQR
jgi:L-glyceraldehyde 3-phosphate reductase